MFLFKICEKMFASGVSCSNFLKLMCIEHKLVFFFSYVFPSLSVVLFALDVNYRVTHKANYGQNGHVVVCYLVVIKSSSFVSIFVS